MKLKPTHGCGGSPTTEIFIQAPVTGATAGAVDGWIATAKAGNDGKTVLEWTGGSLPPDQTGEFPVTFQVPATPGELLTFPSVQVCENGEELSWISGDPESDFPAPRLLILEAGSAPAAELDEIPTDAPGRNLLVEVVDVDNPKAESPTTIAASPSTTAAPTTADSSAPGDVADVNEDADQSNGPWIALAVLAGAVVLAVAGFLLVRRTSQNAD